MFACEMLPKCLVRVQTAIQCSAIYTAIQILEFVNFFPNVNKQLKQTKTAFKKLFTLFFLLRECCDKFESFVLFVRTQEINIGINQP